MLGGPIAFGFVNISHPEQPHVVGSAIQIVGQQIQHAGHQRTAHQRSFFADRIGEFDDWRRGKRLGIFVRDEAERDSLMVAECE